ncbi:MAG: DUF6527 family protein [Pigmentiphaga sp.]
MPEVKTKPVRAELVDSIIDAPAGSIKWFKGNGVPTAGFNFQCPCGCGTMGSVNVAGAARPLWAWDGNWDAPTIHPSIRLGTGPSDASHWHGWLRNGVWESC